MTELEAQQLDRNFYDYPNQSYIDFSGIDLSYAKNLSEYFGSSLEAVELRAIFQTLTIDEFKNFLNTTRPNVEKDIAQEKANFRIEMETEAKNRYLGPDNAGGSKIDPNYSQLRANFVNEALNSYTLEAAAQIKTYEATIYRDYSIVNRKIADSMGISSLEWEQQKMRAKFEVEAEKAWAEKLGQPDFESILIDSEVKRVELNQKRADELGTRFVNLPDIIDNQLNFQRTLAFNGLIEAEMFNEAEQVIIVYENLNDNIKNILYGLK